MSFVQIYRRTSLWLELRRIRGPWSKIKEASKSLWSLDTTMVKSRREPRSLTKRLTKLKGRFNNLCEALYATMGYSAKTQCWTLNTSSSMLIRSWRLTRKQENALTTYTSSMLCRAIIYRESTKRCIRTTLPHCKRLSKGYSKRISGVHPAIFARRQSPTSCGFRLWTDWGPMESSMQSFGETSWPRL